MVQLVRKDKFTWNEKVEEVFQDLKQLFISTLILIYSDPSKSFYFEADLSDFALSTILSQYGKDEKFYPAAFLCRKFSITNINYEKYDRKLLIIVDAFEKW